MAIKIKSVKQSAEVVKQIELIVKQTGTNYMDAVIHYCEKFNVDIEVAASIIRNNPVLKTNIQLEAEDLNFLPKQARLPT